MNIILVLTGRRRPRWPLVQVTRPVSCTHGRNHQQKQVHYMYSWYSFTVVEACLMYSWKAINGNRYSWYSFTIDTVDTVIQLIQLVQLYNRYSWYSYTLGKVDTIKVHHRVWCSVKNIIQCTVECTAYSVVYCTRQNNAKSEMYSRDFSIQQCILVYSVECKVQQIVQYTYIFSSRLVYSVQCRIKYKLFNMHCYRVYFCDLCSKSVDIWNVCLWLKLH